ncbi:hypothetical protein [Sphingomonas asaccharolytica]|uniref:hypothetical protein n=1 Tax=Sphingomonas asaccharolytica TaxID=40681 RepID=UPI00082C4361|nr:hypothetical protein [Sphingomonas asaccharolytica]
MNGAYFLGIVTLILVADLFVALRFRRMADRAENDVGAAPKVGSLDPAAARRVARLMLIGAPLLWLFLAAFSFGLFGPTGNIIPIKF